MIVDLGGQTDHHAANIVGRVAIIVGPQIGRVAEEYPGCLVAEFETGVRNPVAELGIQQAEGGAAKRLAADAVGMGTPRLDIRREITAGAAGEARNERWRVAQPPGVTELVSQLSEPAARRLREVETINAVDAGHVRARRNGVRRSSLFEGVAEILEAAADLELVIEVVEDLAVPKVPLTLLGARVRRFL